jgi:hypothetical protein
VQHLKKRSKDINFSVMHLSRKAHIPLIRTTLERQIIRNRSIIRTSNTSNLEKPKNVSHHFLMFFHNPTPKVHQPPHKLPNHNFPPSFSLNPITPQPFNKQSLVEHHQISDTQPAL